jgi:uncharacterized protein with ACT and thioredoxin-like domain
MIRNKHRRVFVRVGDLLIYCLVLVISGSLSGGLITTAVDVLFRVEHGVALSHNAITGTPQRIFANKASR